MSNFALTCRLWLTSMLTLGRDTATPLCSSLPIQVSSCSRVSSFSTLSKDSTWYGMMNTIDDILWANGISKTVSLLVASS